MTISSSSSSSPSITTYTSLFRTFSPRAFVNEEILTLYSAVNLSVMGTRGGRALNRRRMPHFSPFRGLPHCNALLAKVRPRRAIALKASPMQLTIAPQSFLERADCAVGKVPAIALPVKSMQFNVRMSSRRGARQSGAPPCEEVVRPRRPSYGIQLQSVDVLPANFLMFQRILRRLVSYRVACACQGTPSVPGGGFCICDLAMVKGRSGY